MKNTNPVSPGEIEIRNQIQRAVSSCLYSRKDDQVNIASEDAREQLTRQITDGVLNALKKAYGE